MVLMRAMSLRTCFTRAVFSSWPVAFWKRRLNCSFLRLASSSLSWSRVCALASEAFISNPFLFGDALDEARAHRQLRRAEAQRLAGDLFRHAVDLEHDAARLDAGGPVIDRTLALAHADFGRLAGDRQVREYADPHPALTLHLTGDRAA